MKQIYGKNNYNSTLYDRKKQTAPIFFDQWIKKRRGVASSF